MVLTAGTFSYVEARIEMVEMDPLRRFWPATFKQLES